jgi:hypothetical protein
MRRAPFPRRSALLALLVPVCFAAPPRSPAAPAVLRSGGPPEIVIYNDGSAYIREPRRATLAKGDNEVLLEGVPQRIDSTSVRLEGAGLEVRQQAFRYDLWGSEKVFRRYLGDSIHFRWLNRPSRGVLVGIDGDELFIRRGSADDSTESLLMVRRSQVQELEFPARPGPWGLASTPSLRWRVRAGQAGDRPVTLSYLTAGIEWSAEYVATLSGGDRSLALTGWASITNRSGASFAGSKLSLVAGEVSRSSGAPDRGGAALAEEASAVSARRAYRFDGARDGNKVQALVAFENASSSGLGVPLPAGRVRVFAADASGATTLVGEDAIPHTAAGGAVRLLCGVAFDVTGERVRVAHTRLARNVTEDRFRIRLRNAGADEALVTVAETIYGTWEITEKSADFRAKDAESIEFDVKVPGRGETTLTYTVRYTY